MPRRRREIQPGVVYHMISRFVDRDWYVTTEEERRYYLWLLGRALVESDWRCLAYGVMSNHVHLDAVAGKQPLDSWIRRVHSPFADRMNIKHGRIGVMFVRGPKAIPIPEHDAASTIAYIHNNPVRAGLVSAASDSTWTSHRAYIGLDPAPEWLRVDEGLARAGFTDRTEFDRYVASTVNSATAPQAASPIRNPENELDCLPPCSLARDVVAATVAEVGLPMEQLRSRRRGKLELLARQVAVQAASSLGVTGVEIAGALGLSQQGVSLIGRRRADDGVRTLTRRVLCCVRSVEPGTSSRTGNSGD